MKRIVLLTIAALLMLPAAIAEKVALVGGTMLDGLGGAPVYDSVILIDGETIVDVGTEDSLPVPRGYRVISTEAMTVMPGLWEMHAHLMLNGHSDYAHWDETYIDRFEDEIMPASAVQLLLAGNHHRARSRRTA